MSPRLYRKRRRAEMEHETRERIMEATVKLHAEHGALGTSYAMIAGEAGVSTQTVYNHFPDLGQLVTGCTGHVEARAPSVDARAFAGADSPAERLSRLTAAVYERLEFLAPWLRLGRGEAEVVPELAALFERERTRLRALLEQAVADRFHPTAEFLDSALILLDFPAWKAFTGVRSTEAAARLAARCLDALLPLLTQPLNGDHR